MAARLRKPASVRNDPFMNAKWNEIVRGRDFSSLDVPQLKLLCEWYAVVESCIEDISHEGRLPQVAYQNDIGDIKAVPQLSTMKQASAEIRALNKQLGINDEARPKEKARKATVLHVIQGNRKDRSATASKVG